MPLFRRSSSKEGKSDSRSESGSGTASGGGGGGTTSSREHSIFHRLNHPETPHLNPSPSHASPTLITQQPEASKPSQEHHHHHHSRFPSDHHCGDHPSHDGKERSSSRSSSKHRATANASAYPSQGHGGAHDQLGAGTLTDGLTKDDVQTLFRGAPYFMLESGRRHRFFPQSYFPFTSPLDITDLQDRMYLKHESFALCSLHAHLPIPYEVNFKDGYEIQHGSLPLITPSRGDGGLTPTMEHTPEGQPTSKRPMFDMGIYERPNMLSLQGIEPGTIGMRNYLELPVADGLVKDGIEEHPGRDSDIGADHGIGFDIDKTPASEAFKYLAHDEGNSAKIGKRAPAQNRLEILKGGPKVWKRIGVRAITMKAITERLEEFSRVRDIVVERGWRYTILDEYGSEALGKQLFGELLYPPAKSNIERGGEGDLKVQIEALVKVLTTPGAWLDFSLPAERLLFAQNLYTKDIKGQDIHGITPQEKRRWSLIQLLLATELVARLDAALRKGVAMHSKDLPVSNDEIRHFNQLRNLKVDWDLMIGRRWLDLCYAKRMPAEVGSSNPDHITDPRAEEKQTGRGGLLGRMKHSLSFRQDDHDDPHNTDWDVAILPRQSRMMAEGLLRFGSDIGWPQQNLDIIHESFITKLRDATLEQKERMLAKGVETLDHPHVPQHAMDKSIVELRQASEKTLGGPLSHAWMGGLVVPGYITCDLLMCTLLEHDPDALDKLGTMAHVRSGFVLDGKSYWSKACICATVLAGMDGAKERMGWIGLPQYVGPVDEELNALGDGWRVVVSDPTPKMRQGERIFDGEAMSEESSPLGVGKGKILSTEFNMVTDQLLDDVTKEDGEVDVKSVELMLHRKKSGKPDDDEEYQASVGFQVSANGEQAKQVRFRLRFNAKFIGAHPCKTPHGHVGHVGTPSTEATPGTAEILSRSTTTSTVNSTSFLSPTSTITSSSTTETETPITSPLQSPSTEHPTSPVRHPRPHPHRLHHHKHPDRLPAHPLHCSFKYTPKSLYSLLTLGPNDWLPTPTDKEAGTVWIVDARGSREKETVARAWCAFVGRDAIISRVGKGCIGCAVREARALEVGVLVRVG